MTTVARLTWQAADPRMLASALERRLGLVAIPDRDRFAAPLGTATLEVVPWRSEVPEDRAHDGGRLVLEPLWEPVDASRVEAAGAAAVRLVAVGWSTVELDRAERDLEMWLKPAPRDDGGDVREPLLGAIARVRRAPELPGGCLALLEPTTEGRLAASLARDGEGPCCLYLAPVAPFARWRAAARARGVALSRRTAGPLGTGVLVLGGPVGGPHLVVVDAPHTVAPPDGGALDGGPLDARPPDAGTIRA